MAFQGDSIYWVEVEKIVPNPYQPRREFDESKLAELAESVRMYGVLQPLTVTRKEVSREDGTFYTEYELIAGERRLRASKLAQLAQVPVIIRTGEQSDQEKLELAIIENLQREDLNAVDRAIAFKQLADQFSMSHAQVAKKVGRSREYVSNSMRLLQLPEYMLVSLKGGDITEGHGRTLLMLNDRPEEQDTVFREILLKKLSVREVERIARKIATDKVRKKDWGMDPVLIEIEKKFTDTLGTRVQIQKTDYGGKLVIDYFTNDDLEKLLGLINKTEEEMREEMQQAAILAATTPLDLVTTEQPEDVSDLGFDPVTEPADASLDIASRVAGAFGAVQPIPAEELTPDAGSDSVTINTPIQESERGAVSYGVVSQPRSVPESEQPEQHPTSFYRAEPRFSSRPIPQPHQSQSPSEETAVTQQDSEISTPKVAEGDTEATDLYSVRNFSL